MATPAAVFDGRMSTTYHPRCPLIDTQPVGRAPLVLVLLYDIYQVCTYWRKSRPNSKAIGGPKAYARVLILTSGSDTGGVLSRCARSPLDWTCSVCGCKCYYSAVIQYLGVCISRGLRHHSTGIGDILGPGPLVRPAVSSYVTKQSVVRVCYAPDQICELSLA